MRALEDSLVGRASDRSCSMAIECDKVRIEGTFSFVPKKWLPRVHGRDAQHPQSFYRVEKSKASLDFMHYMHLHRNPDAQHIMQNCRKNFPSSALAIDSFRCRILNFRAEKHGSNRWRVLCYLQVYHPGSTMRSVGQDSSKKPPRPGHGPGPVARVLRILPRKSELLLFDRILCCCLTGLPKKWQLEQIWFPLTYYGIPHCGAAAVRLPRHAGGEVGSESVSRCPAAAGLSWRRRPARRVDNNLNIMFAATSHPDLLKSRTI